MQKLSKFILLPLLAVMLFSVAFVMAQDTTDEVTAQELGISEPTLLPNSPFYFLKEWMRGLHLAFTFKNTDKAELMNKIANEKLAELEKIAESGLDSNAIQNATENYQKAIEKIKQITDKIKETAEENKNVSDFLEKFANHQILHERILKRLQEQVSEGAFKVIQQARERHMERFGEVMQKLEVNQERITERLQNALQNRQGNSEVLEDIIENMPNSLQGQVNQLKQKAQNQQLK